MASETAQPGVAMGGGDGSASLGAAELRCPECEYNLTGLPEPRCPECGLAFEWQDVIRWSREQRPTIYFERVRSWRKIPGFFVTWLTVLLLPWVFARQITRRVSSRHAAVFLLVCFVGVSIPHAVTAFPIWIAWLTAACVCIVLESLLLTALDPAGWRKPLATYRFWLCAGCYTSAVMITETYAAPPLLGLSDLWQMAADWTTILHGKQALITGMPGLLSPGWYQWCQIGVWIAALACCLAHRARGAPRRRWFVIPLLVVLLLLCYGFCVEFVGVNVADYFDVGW